MTAPTEVPSIVHQDDELLVLFKPSGLPTTAPDEGDCLVARAKILDPGAPRLHPSSRLDAEVSGLVTFARTKRATRTLILAREQRRYARRYLGLAFITEADVPTAGVWRGRVGIDPADSRRRVVDAGRAQKEAATDFEFGLRAGPGVLLHLWPQTGRTHQLRVHAAAAGMPLLGDVHYGGPRRLTLSDGRVVRAPRAMLHCAALRVPHPNGGELCVTSSPPPPDFCRVWERVGGGLSALAIDGVEP